MWRKLRLGKLWMKARIESSLLLSPRNVLVFLSRNRIKIETSKEEPLALKIEAEAFFLFVCLFQFWQRLVHDIYIYIYIPYITSYGDRNDAIVFHIDNGFSRGKNGMHYHTSHLWIGFIREPSGQLNSAANSGRFESDPITLYFDGQWASFSIWRATASDIMAEHQTWEQTRLPSPSRSMKRLGGMKRILPEQNSERTIVDASN